MRNLTNTIIGFVFCLTANGQTFTGRLILTDDTNDSLYLKSSSISFDRQGNYCFVIEKNKQKYFVTNKDTIGGFTGGIYSSGGGVSYNYLHYSYKDEPFYYKNANGTKVYGTVVGKIENFETSNTRENIAMISILNDTVYYYINGKLLTKNLKGPRVSYYLEQGWVSFSENGNVIYSLKKDNVYCLYLNDFMIDSAKYGYYQLAVKNNGTFIYEKRSGSKQPHQFFINLKDTVLQFAGVILDYELKENGAYYCSDCDDDKSCYIGINGKLYENIQSISNIILVDKNTHLFRFYENGENKINVNGRIYSHGFEQIFFPTLDKNGNFAFFGLKDYYLYKFVNGEKVKEPLSKYGVRAIPLYISPKGESIHFFKTDDSIYLYQDEKLLFPPISKNTNFRIIPHKEVFSYNYVRGKTENGNSLFYLEYGEQGYFVFNGKFSESLLPVQGKRYSRYEENGMIAAGIFNDYGFFAIQKIDEKKYLININNEIYKELDDVDSITYDNYFFDDKSLIFYGVKGKSFYQFNLSL